MPQHTAAVTVTRTTTTSSSTAIILNTGYMKTVPGILKLLQTILNLICVIIVSYYFRDYYYYVGAKYLFFLLIATTFLVSTAILFLSCLLSLATASLLPKTLFDYLYHSIAFFLYLTAVINLFIAVSDNDYRLRGYSANMAAAILAAINVGLYLFHAIKSYKTYYL